MAGLLMKQPGAILDRAHLEIGRAKIKPADAGEGNRRRAHGARLERDIEIAVWQPLTVKLSRSFTYRQKLGVGGGVFQLNRTIAGRRQYFASGGCDDGAHRHFAPGQASASFHERKLHRSG